MIVNNAIIVNDTLWSHFICSTSDRLEAETLELRRLKSDLTVMFSIIRGFVDIDCNSLFRVIDCESVHTHGHNLTLGWPVQWSVGLGRRGRGWRAGAVPRSWRRCGASELCAEPAAVALLRVGWLSVRCCVLLCVY